MTVPLRCFYKEKCLHYHATSYIYAKRRTLSASVALNESYQNSYLNMHQIRRYLQYLVRGPSICYVYIAQQCLVNFDLRDLQVERMGKSYDGEKTVNFFERLDLGIFIP